MCLSESPAGGSGGQCQPQAARWGSKLGHCTDSQHCWCIPTSLPSAATTFPMSLSSQPATPAHPACCCCRCWHTRAHTDESQLARLDSSVKKNGTFIKKLRQLGADNGKQLLAEAAKLNLSKVRRVCLLCLVCVWEGWGDP